MRTYIPEVMRKAKQLNSYFKKNGLKGTGKFFSQLLEGRVCKFFSKPRRMEAEGILKNPRQKIKVSPGGVKGRVSRGSEDKYKYKYGFDFYDVTGVILGGDWDRYPGVFKSDPCFIALRERFKKGKEWEETLYYRLFKKRINYRTRKTDSWEGFKKMYLLEWDKIYEDMKKNGYKNQEELENKNTCNEVRVCVSRDGEVIFRDGRHRLSMAKILEIEEIPVVVNVWHKKFIDKLEKKINPKKITPSTAAKFLRS